MLRPKLFTTLKGYTRHQFAADLMSGTIVGIIAIPLAIAFAIASGVKPEMGLYTAVIAGFIISLLGGSRVQIGGPTGAFVVIVYAIVEKHGVNGLAVATILAGLILVVLGLLKLGSLIKFIPHPLVVGFTSGIAVLILVSQVRDFLGLAIDKVPADFIEKIGVYARHAGEVNPYALGVAGGCVLLIVFWKYVSARIPGSLVALVLATVAVQVFQLPVETIGARFGAIPSSLPAPSFPHIDFATIQQLLGPAIAIALLGGIESLLSAVVADGMIGSRHRSNMELVAQGIANIASPIFGGIPATGAIARTAANVKNGGRTPVAGIVHALVLLLVLLFLGQWAALVPLPCLAAVLVVVAYNMSEWRSFVGVMKATTSGAVLLLVVFGLTVFFDLTVAIEVGLVLAAFLFLRRMSAASDVHVAELDDEEEDPDDPDAVQRTEVPAGVEVYEVDGPFFFGAVDKFREAMAASERMPRVRILRMRRVPVIDSTGVHVLAEFAREAKHGGGTLLLSGLRPQPREILESAGVLAVIGEANALPDLHAALNRARKLLGLPLLGFADLVRKGGVHGPLAAANPLEAARQALAVVPLPEGIDRDHVLQLVVARETLAPTGVGHGLAVPHTHQPVLARPEDERVAVCYLDPPVEYGALDKEPVHTLLVALDARPKRHLEILSLVAHAAREPEFLALMKRRAPSEEVLAFLERMERGETGNG